LGQQRFGRGVVHPLSLLVHHPLSVGAGQRVAGGSA
jgi:hypothetical protein